MNATDMREAAAMVCEMLAESLWATTAMTMTLRGAAEQIRALPVSEDEAPIGDMVEALGVERMARVGEDENVRLRARVRRLEAAGEAVVFHHRPVRGNGCGLCAVIAALEDALSEREGGEVGP